MAIRFECPTCGGVLRVADEAAGSSIRCGECLTLVRVPDAPPAPPPPRDDFPAEPRPDDPPRPRRRRPRRERYDTPPPGRGALFWVFLILAILFVGCCGCCGGIYLLLPREQWHTHESARGGFKVDLPAPLVDAVTIPGMPSDPNLQSEGALLWKRMEFYVVWQRPIPARLRNDGDDAVLDDAVRNIESDPEVDRIVRQTPVTVSGFPGREIEYRDANGGTYVVRIVAADSRLYGAVGGGPLVDPDNPNVRRFLDSFEITDPDLLDGRGKKPAGKREAEPKADPNPVPPPPRRGPRKQA